MLRKDSELHEGPGHGLAGFAPGGGRGLQESRNHRRGRLETRRRVPAAPWGVPWRNIINTRNLPIHAYDQVNPAILGNVVERDIPELRERSGGCCARRKRRHAHRPDPIRARTMAWRSLTRGKTWNVSANSTGNFRVVDAGCRRHQPVELPGDDRMYRCPASLGGGSRSRARVLK